jgi:Peptidase family M41
LLLERFQVPQPFVPDPPPLPHGFGTGLGHDSFAPFSSGLVAFPGLIIADPRSGDKGRALFGPSESVKLQIMEPPYDQTTAYHEAGHAVVALALGRPIHQVSILPNRGHLGICEFGKGVFRPSEDWLEREILIALGGIAAEARFTGDYSWDGAGLDFQYVRKLTVQRAGERRAERLERRLLSKVEHLLAQEGHWRAVELIAAELLRCGEISGRAARHLFERGCDAC